MPKLTKIQKRRLVKEILSKSKKLYMITTTSYSVNEPPIVSTKDMEAIERMSGRWIKRIG